MPYQLNYAGNNTTLKRRIAPFPLPTNFTQDLRIDVTFIHANSGSWQAYLNTPDTVATNNTFFLVACDSSNAIYFYSGGVQLNTGVTAVTGQIYTVSVTVSTSKVVGISVNGGAYNTASYPNLNASLFGQLLFGATTNSDGSIYRDTFIGQLRRVETWVGGSKTGDYTNTTGTGTTLVNSIGGAVATQLGTWPADNSEWVPYFSPTGLESIWRNFPTGSIKPSAFIPWNNAEPIISEFWQAPPITDFTASVSGSLPKLTASITLQSVSAGNTLAVNSQLPKLTGSITGLSATTITTFISVSLPKLTGSVALNSSVPVFTAVVSGQLPKLTGSLSLTSTAPTFTATVNGQLPKLTASVALNNAGLVLTANINATLPKLTGSVAILSEMPLSQIDVAATLPLLTASIELFSPIIYPPADANDFTVSLTLAGAETQQARIEGDLTMSADIDSLSVFNARISPTVGFSAIISSTYKFNGRLN